MKNILFAILFGISLSNGSDNSSLHQKNLLKHQKTYGVVFIVPQKATKKLLESSEGLLNQALLQNNLIKESLIYNIPHISVIHIHNPDPSTPYKILKALPKPPKPFSLSLKNYVFSKVSPNSSFPWWFQINVEKNLDYDIINQYNYKVTESIAPLRSSPLPHSSGFIYQDLPLVAKSQIEDLGSSGLNRIKNGKKEEYFRPHMTLIYSGTHLDKKLSDFMEKLSEDFNREFPTPIIAKFDTLSIVELGFLGNVLREIYRIDLESGAIFDVEKGTFIKLK